MKFQYTQLQPGAIRILRFSQYAKANFVHAWLEHLPNYARKDAHYSVITHGIHSEEPADQKSITLNGRSFVVPSALHEAMGAIISYHDSNTAFWTDSVCVNHGDPADVEEHRIHETSIYTNADEVLVWIGEEDERTCVCFHLAQVHANSCSNTSLDTCCATGAAPAAVDDTERAALSSILQRPYLVAHGLQPDVLQMTNSYLLCGKYKCATSTFVHYLAHVVSSDDNAARQDELTTLARDFLRNTKRQGSLL